MENEEEPLIDWEQETVVFQKALEAALEYQRQLEGKIEKLEAENCQQAEEYRDKLIKRESEFQDILMDMVLASHARELEQEIESLKSRTIPNLRATIDTLRSALREKTEMISSMKRKHQEHSRKQRERDKQQAEEIQKLKQGLQIQQRLLREQRGMQES